MRARDFGKPSEKPYVLIPFPEGDPRRSPVQGHHHYAADRYTGHLDLRLTTLTPLQVASGFQDVATVGGREQVLLQQAGRHRDGRRVPVVPASSLKGAIRSLVEILSRSCLPVLASPVRPHAPRPLARCTSVERLCPACSLFGMAGASHNAAWARVAFEDAVVADGREREALQVVATPLLWTGVKPGRRLPDRYLEGRQVKGRKVYYHRKPASGPDAREAFKPGATLQTRMYVVNVSAAELGLIASALGQHPSYRFPVKLGAAKPVGLGSVRVEIVNFAFAVGPGERGLTTRGRLGGGALPAQPGDVGAAVQRWVEAAEREGLLVRDNLARLARALDEGGLKESAPSGPY